MCQWNRIAVASLALIGVVAVADESWAGGRITSVQRELRLFAGDAFDDQTLSLQSASLGLFADSRSLTFFSNDGGGGGTAEASQTSTVTLDTVTGVASGTASGGGGVGTGSAGGRSLIDVLFTVDQATAFELDGSVTVTGSLFSRTEVSLTRTAPDMVEIFRAKRGEEQGEGTTDFSGANQVTGVLDPGSYRFLASAWAIDVDFVGADASFDVSLIVPEPHAAALLTACGLAGAIGLRPSRRRAIV